MKNQNERSSLCSPRYRSALPVLLLALFISGCGKSPERPGSPQTPPRPQVMDKAFASDVHKAVFSYSSEPSTHFQDGRGLRIQRRVIHT